MIKFKWNDFDFALIQFDKGVFTKDMAGHSHAKNIYELHYITEGEGTLITDSKTYPLSKGDFFVTGPNVYHQQTTHPENHLTEIYIYLQASEKKTKDALVSSFLSTHFFFSKEKELHFLFEEMLKERDNALYGYSSAIGALMQLLLTRISRFYMPSLSGLTDNSNNLNDRRFIIIEHAFINTPDTLTLSGLSDLIGLCERQTQRLLLKYYGKTFKEKKKESIREHRNQSFENGKSF